MIRTIVICLLLASTAHAQTTPTPMQAAPKKPYTEKEPEPPKPTVQALPEKFPVTKTPQQPMPSLAGARRCVMQTTPISDILQCDNGITVIYIRP